MDDSLTNFLSDLDFLLESDNNYVPESDDNDILNFLNEAVGEGPSAEPVLEHEPVPLRSEPVQETDRIEEPKEESSRYFQYNDELPLLANVKRATQFHRYKKFGFSFVGFRHRLGVDPDSEHIAASLYTKCMRDGNNHFVMGETVYNSRKRKWFQGRVKDDGDNNDCEEEYDTLKFDQPTPKKVKKTCAIVNTIDKIKVMTGPYNDEFMTKLSCMNSLEGVETHEPIKGYGYGKITSAFLLQKTKFGPVPSTRVTYKRADYTANPNAHTVMEKPNNSNINGTRGSQEFVIVNRINEAHSVCNNPYGDIFTNIVRECENNNSLTVDSGVNSTVNMSFKAKACQKSENSSEDGRFILIPKAEYGTHKTTVVSGTHKREDVENCSKTKEEDSDRKIIMRSINSREVQVHAHCINCSALGGYQIIGAIKNITAKIMDDPIIIASLAANNAKAMMMSVSHSLVWSHINTFIDVCAWKYRLHQYPLEKQMEFYVKVLIPILQNLFLSRYNYSQAGIFCHSVTKPTALYDKHDYKLVTQKFKSCKTSHLFQKAGKITDEATDLNKMWNSKRPLAMSKTVNPAKRFKEAGQGSFSIFTTQPARGQSIPDLWYHGAERSRKQIAIALGGPEGNER
uniref:ORF2 n=1 Tax=Malaco herpesvirus 1 TaxID=3031797 RepID=A0AA48SF24_9VIRU|nr:TPA_asm: ORF2 [Malaco herpesvirus 1]